VGNHAVTLREMKQRVPQVTGMAVVQVHLGYGKAATTGEFTAIRLEHVAQ
jgi:hypothetical protein